MGMKEEIATGYIDSAILYLKNKSDIEDWVFHDLEAAKTVLEN